MTFNEFLRSRFPRPVWDASGQGGGAGNGNPPEGGAGKGQDGAPDPFAELDEVTREWVKTRHEGDVAKLAKQAYELDKFAGSAIQIPGSDAKDEDWGSLWSKLGRPEAPDGYEFKVPENLPENLPYDEDLAGKAKTKFHELGLNKKQAAELHDFFVETQMSAVEAATGKMTANVTEMVDEANTTLKAAWGDPAGETYRTNMELAGRFFDAIDPDNKLNEALQKAGFIGPDKEVLLGPLAIAFAKAGAATLQEGVTLPGNGPGGQIGDNPFMGDKPNLTNIMALVKADPDKAVVLCKAAGKNPADFGIRAA
jgi:hypothetical protein